MKDKGILDWSGVGWQPNFMFSINWQSTYRAMSYKITKAMPQLAFPASGLHDIEDSVFSFASFI